MEHTGLWKNAAAAVCTYLLLATGMTPPITIPDTSVMTDTYAEEPFSAKFRWGQDNWSFNNTKSCFPSAHQINDTLLPELSDDFHLTNAEREFVKALSDRDSLRSFKGACYGMTSAEILVRQGMLDLSAYGGNSIVNQNSNTPEILSLINFLYEFQKLPHMGQINRCAQHSGYPYTQPELLSALADAVQGENGLFNLSYSIAEKDAEGNPRFSTHSVLAYGLEECAYTSEITGRTYDRRILIADPNFLSRNQHYEDACLYFDSSDNSWIIPCHNKTDGNDTTCYWNADSGADTPDGSINLIVQYTSLTEWNDLMTEEKPAYLNRLQSYYSSRYTPSARTYAHAEQNDRIAGTADSRTLDTYHYWTFSGTQSIEQSFATPADFFSVMDYEKIAYMADVKNTSDIRFSSDGSLELTGEAISYDVSIITEDDVCVTDWYTVSVIGNHTDSLTFTMTNDGYMITADTLQNITVTAHNTEVSAETVFSTEYHTVLIYEIGENAIGVAADADGDGIFDTDIIGCRFSALALDDYNGMPKHF